MIEHVADQDGGERPPAPADPAVGWASGPLGVAQAAEREIARQTAVRARALAAFAGTRPAAADRPPGRPGAMRADRRAARAAVLAEVSEWAAPEVAVALSLPTATAEALLARSLTLVHALPGSLAALEAGLLSVGICGRCWSGWPRSPTGGCGSGWRPICWPGWPPGR